jgi:rhodanese-related sulfurtransferase
MFTFVSADWVQQRLESPDVLLIDPRSPVRYMAGHPKNAVNLPVPKSRDAQGTKSITAKLFVRADADETTLRELWKQAYEGSPVTQSVVRGTPVIAEFGAV